jgi:hypothetical protein
MAQQTAVDWLMSEMLKPDMYKIWTTLLERAKQMEKEQIINTYLNACARVTPYGYYNDSAEQYYNETYEKNSTLD